MRLLLALLLGNAAANPLLSLVSKAKSLVTAKNLQAPRRPRYPLLRKAHRLLETPEIISPGEPQTLGIASPLIPTAKARSKTAPSPPRTIIEPLCWSLDSTRMPICATTSRPFFAR